MALALVTGACGFSGSHMVEVLRARGHEVLATDIPGSDSSFVKSLGAEFLPSDVTKKETLAPLFGRGPELLFHPASLFDYFAPWEPLYKVNVVGMRNLCEAAADSGLKSFLHWSTLGVYGETGLERPADESTPFDPPNLYSKSKVEQESVAQEFVQLAGLPLTIIRPAPMFGPRNRYGMYHIYRLLAKTGTAYIPSIYPRHKRLRMPMLHVRDACGAALFLSEKGAAKGEAYNVVNTMDFTVDEFMAFVAIALGIRSFRVPIGWLVYAQVAKLMEYGARKFEEAARLKRTRPKFDLPMAEYITHEYWFSNEKIKRAGYKFVYDDWRRATWETIGWYREQGWLPL